MACFTVSAIGAIGVGIARRIVKHNEKKNNKNNDGFGSDIKWSRKLAYLELTLAGGSFILMLEHIMHGEITFYPPFLTAMNSADDTIQMLKEIGTSGVAMFLLLILAWSVGIFFADLLKYKKRKAKNIKESEAK